MRKPAFWALAILVLALAAYFRFASLATGLPQRSSRPDEYTVLLAAANVRNDFRLHYWIYPGMFVYLMWAWCYVAHLVLPFLTGGLSYGEAVHQQPTSLLVAGRALSATASVATVGLTMAIGRWLGDRPTALLAGLLTAVNTLPERDAHSMKADAMLSLALLATIAVILRQRTPGRARDGICLGAAVGSACGMKYSAIAGLLAYAGAVIDGGPGWRRWLPPARLWVGAVVAAAVFLVTSISIFYDYQSFRNLTTWNALAVFNPGHELTSELSDVVGYLGQGIAWQSFDYHLTRSLRIGSGLLTAFALLPALVWSFFFAGPKWRTIAVSFLLYLALIGSSAVRLVRYFSPLAPLVSLMVAAAAVRAVERVASERARPALLVGLALVLAWEPARRARAYVRVAGATDTRVLATDFLEHNLPRGTRIGILGTRVWPFGAPEIPPGFEKLARSPDPSITQPGDVIITHEHSLPFSRLAPGELEQAVPCRTELVRFSPYDASWRTSRYEPADAYYVPLDGFTGVVRPGPIVTIYRVDACVGAGVQSSAAPDAARAP
jgi:hypothetical protein